MIILSYPWVDKFLSRINPGVKGCIFFIFILVRTDIHGPFRDTVIRHEKIHFRQMRDMLFIFGYLFYVVELIIKLIYYRDIIRAYRALSFESEAYAHQDEVDYLKRRTWLSVLRYVLI